MTYDRYGDDSVLTLTELPRPKVGPGEALVRVRAAGVNPVDWKVMAGGLDGLMDTFFPVVPGWDVAGVVEEVGIDTPEVAVGDAVMAYARKDVVHAGTFAEYVTVPVRALAPTPEGMGWAEAGALPLAGLTALRVLDRLEVAPGEVLLVHGGAGGVGSLTVQVAVARGARVLATASPRNHEFLRSLGAEPVAYGDGVVERVRALAPSVDAVADVVGGVLDVTLAVLRPGGRHVSVADASVLGAGGAWVWVRPDAGGLRELAGLVESGRLHVPVAATFPLERLADAFALSREGHVRGKVVVTVGD